jgi:hypothetical protein
MAFKGSARCQNGVADRAAEKRLESCRPQGWTNRRRGVGGEVARRQSAAAKKAAATGKRNAAQPAN